jgi:hypothetical protein
MDHQADTTPMRRTTHSGIPFSPPRGDDVSLARLKNVEQNDDSLASGSLYHHCDDDDFEGSGMVMSQTCYCKVHCVPLYMKQHCDGF